MTLEPLQWLLVIVGAMTVGLNKAGLMGAATINVVIMANLFGGIVSTGIVLPMLIIADVFAVAYYRRHADWPVVLKLLPWTLVGITIGTLLGAQISDELFRRAIAVLVLVTLGMLIYPEIRGKELRVTHRWWSAAILGVLAGFTTMVGNAAGAVMTLYLLSMGYEKNRFIGTTAWFFFIVNLIKVPFHLFIWHSITWDTLKLDLIAAPAIIAGVFGGILLVKVIKERPYRIFVIVVTALLSVRLLIA
jgi:uncharacterized protein